MKKKIQAQKEDAQHSSGELLQPDAQKAVAQLQVPAHPPMHHRWRALIHGIRPRQWSKNLSLFIGLVFAGQLFHVIPFVRALLAFFVFCLASSSIYLLNDLLDIEKDRQHPLKRLRPLASGRLPIQWAWTMIGVLLAGCALLMVLLGQFPPINDIYQAYGGATFLFVASITVYLILMVFYSFYLKHIVLIDVFVIATGFVLRIIAGTVVIPVIISPWLYLVTCFLSLFLALGKRRQELVLLQQQASEHRQNLKEYSMPLLDQLITIMVTCTVITYSLYTFEGPTGNRRLIVTIPLVLYGVCRYLYLVYVRMEGGSPEEVLLRDWHMLGTVIICTTLIIGVLYLLPY